MSRVLEAPLLREKEKGRERERERERERTGFVVSLSSIIQGAAEVLAQAKAFLSLSLTLHRANYEEEKDCMKRRKIDIGASLTHTLQGEG